MLELRGDSLRSLKSPLSPLSLYFPPSFLKCQAGRMIRIATSIAAPIMSSVRCLGVNGKQRRSTQARYQSQRIPYRMVEADCQSRRLAPSPQKTVALGLLASEEEVFPRPSFFPGNSDFRNHSGVGILDNLRNKRAEVSHLPVGGRLESPRSRFPRHQLPRCDG